MPSTTLLILTFITTVASDQCDGASCSACTAEAGCGWCDGNAYDSHGSIPPCLGLNSTSTWTCDGKFKNAGQCECAGTNVPADLVFPWRGFYIDATTSGEVGFAFSNAASGQGRVTMYAAGQAAAGNVTTFQGCPKNVLQVQFDNGTKLACAYRLGWQTGGDAYALALGCNTNASAPTDFDTGAQSIQLFTCTDPSHCDFAKVILPLPASPSPAQPAIAEPLVAPEDACSTLTTCSACGAAAGCSWCLGQLTESGKQLPGLGHCFGDESSQFSCTGITLAKDCSVYKCPWYYYYDQGVTPNCSALTSACAAPTTADDPDFNRSYPASAFLSADECHQSCVDPTVGCTGTTCAKTFTCNVSSSCSSCETVDLPKVIQGLQISNNYTAGLWTFRFDTSPDGRIYTGLNITSPLGTTTNYTVHGWTGTTATLATGSSQYGVRFDGVSNTGALGKNIYIAIGKDSAIPAFGKVMYTPGNAEFAMLACEFDYAGHPVSGQYKPLACKVGALTLEGH